MNINLRQVIEALNPVKPPEIMIAAIVLYAIGLLVLIALFMQKESNMRNTMMLSAVLLVVLIDKIAATSNLRDTLKGFEHNSFGVFIIRTLMFTFPLVVAGGTKTEKSRPLLILAGLTAGVYLFARWFLEIRPQ